MEFFSPLLAADPASPRLTVYDDSTGARLDFSATTLNNWACKIANMLSDEFDLAEGDSIGVCLPAGWQATVIAVGAAALGITVEYSDISTVAVLFASADRVPQDADCEICLVTADPFGRGVAECGGTVPDGMVDFGPTVRMYGDDYPWPTPTVADYLTQQHPQLELPEPGARLLSTGFHDAESFARCVLAPWAVGGSAVVVHSVASTSRVEEIAAAEKVTGRI
ncbi:TIGR03089 family protein [Corynebacterium aquilae]|uniref:TIGR03089 family protein n=1 Tax=Corynebacterium aquilae DSM 44791 TaxID=1431546 RepID=A0A1L7CEC5_9CORY|nr:TIGR03089 family protein [Corynebacterium aquilae]APT84178.1 hypothetical protein CAQU_02815 [Corynebacterium aquilae DSM 44791]